MSVRRLLVRVLQVSGLLVLAFIAFVVYYFNFVLSGPRGQTPFAVAHTRAVKTFVEGKGFGIHRFRKKEDFNEHSFMIEGEEWSLDEMSLIGASQEYGDRYYEGGRWEISKNKLGEVEHRPLTPPEAEALGELREKRANFVTLKVGENEEPGSLMKKVMAGIPARTSCLECHDAREDELLGAFVYLVRRR